MKNIFLTNHQSRTLLRHGEATLLMPSTDVETLKDIRIGQVVCGKETWGESMANPVAIAFQANLEVGAWVGDSAGGRVWNRHGWVMAKKGTPNPHKDSTIGRFYSAGTVKWKSPILMHADKSRHVLEITACEDRRIDSLTGDDAVSAGLGRVTKDGRIYKYGFADLDGMYGNDDYGWHWQDWHRDPVDAIRHAFGIHGRNDQLVWVLKVKRLPLCTDMDGTTYPELRG